MAFVKVPPHARAAAAARGHRFAAYPRCSADSHEREASKTDMIELDASPSVRRGLASRARPLIQVVWAVSWVVVSFRLLTPMAYHYWAAGGPPAPNPGNPEWHQAWGNLFFAAVLACWAIGGLGVWFMRRRRAPSGSSTRGSASALFSVLMVLLIMGLAVWSVPGTGRLVLLAPIVLGAVWAFARARRSEGRK
jgi:hypothetical protein